MKKLWIALEIIGIGVAGGLTVWHTIEGGILGFLYAICAGALGWMTVEWFMPLIFPRLFGPSGPKE